jgi:hypothetical protein
MNLGTLKKIDLREAWKHEANDFTKWLAEEQNLSLLADEIGFELKLVQVEAEVGDFSADILAEEQNTSRKIIIENQLEATDHNHLGQIITYASGYNAGVIVWVVRDVREEHRHAIDWLNEHTDETIEFFLVKIELWQIGDSQFAPKFDIIYKPNDWAKTVKGGTGGNQELTETRLKQLEFWTAFRDYAQQQQTKLRFQKPQPQNWIVLGLGFGGTAYLSLTLSSREGDLGVELYIPDNKVLFEQLLARKADIEQNLGETANFMALPEKKASRVKVTMPGEFTDKEQWNSYFKWLLREADKFASVFPKHLKAVGA